MINVGWPEGIYITLLFLNLIISAANHGKPRSEYSFPMQLTAFMVSLTLLYLGGFFE